MAPLKQFFNHDKHFRGRWLPCLKGHGPIEAPLGLPRDRAEAVSYHV